MTYSKPSTLVPDNWYESFFTGPINSFWESVMPPEATHQEVDFIVRQLGVHPGERLLDVPCGTGRHSLELSRRGFRMTSVDVSFDAVTRLRERLIELPDRAECSIEVAQADMAGIDFDSSFDGIVCMGNSFGYLPHDGMMSFLRGVRNALRPNGRFLIDTGMTAESVLLSHETDATYEMGGYVFEIRNEYDIERSRLVSHTVLKKDGAEWRQSFSHAVYTCAELGRMFDAAGLNVISRSSDVASTPYKLGDPRLLLVAERR